MAIGYEPPNEALMRELNDVSRDAKAVAEYFRSPNALPDTFPAAQIKDICEALQDLPKGTARGCREPLEYARTRLPAIRREHIIAEDRAGFHQDDDEPALMRGMGLDRLLLDLTGSVLTALDEFRYQASMAEEDKIGSEPAIEPANDPAVATAATNAQAVKTHLDRSSIELAEIAEPSSKRADSLSRRMRDASGLSKLVYAELRMRTIVFRWYDNIAKRISEYPDLIFEAGRSIEVGVDILKPFQKRWDTFWSDMSNFSLNQIREFGSTLVEVGEILRKNRGVRGNERFY